MKKVIRILKLLAIIFTSIIALIGIFCIALLIGNIFSLETLGNTTLYFGLGVALLGILAINFRRTVTDLHIRHQGTVEEKRQKLKIDLADYNIGYIIILAGAMTAFIGWLVLNIYFCDRLICR